VKNATPYKHIFNLTNTASNSLSVFKSHTLLIHKVFFRAMQGPMLHCHLPAHHLSQNQCPKGNTAHPTPPRAPPISPLGPPAPPRGSLSSGELRALGGRRQAPRGGGDRRRDAKGRPDPASLRPAPLRAAGSGQAAEAAARRRPGLPHSLEDGVEAALPPQLGEALEADGVGLLESAQQLLAVRLQPRHRGHPAGAEPAPPAPSPPQRACAAASRHTLLRACALPAAGGRSVDSSVAGGVSPRPPGPTPRRAASGPRARRPLRPAPGRSPREQGV